MATKKQVNSTKADSKLSSSSSRIRDSKQSLNNRAIPLQQTIGNHRVGQLLQSEKSESNPTSRDPTQKKANNNLPEGLQSNLETSFGQDFSNVNIHKNSRQALELNALAFTQDENIHFAPGQFNPNSESGTNLIGHEFTHVVQQRSGGVKPTTMLGKGLSVNEDSGLETEADHLGKRAARGESIAKYQSSGLGIRNSLRTVQAKSSVIQRAVTTWGGSWDTEQYDLRRDKDPYGRVFPAATGVRGVDIKLKFTPNSNVNAKLIGLTQIANGFVGGAYISPAAGRAITSSDAISVGGGETDEGMAIDRVSNKNNPIYGASNLAAGAGLDTTSVDNNSTANPLQLGVTGGGNATYQLGYRYKSGGSWISKDAMLFDGPTMGNVAKNSRQIFETTALAIKGSQVNTYYGSVQWGWRTDAAGNFSKVSFQVVSQGVPSSSFMKAAGLWNASKTSTGKNTVNLPLEDVQLISNLTGVDIGLGPVFTHLPFGTRVVVQPGLPSMTESFIRVVDGPFTGETGQVLNSELSDERP